jgi:hypothetical protein
MTKQDNNQERRRFSRIPFNVAADLQITEDESITVEVIDLSLHGLLIAKPTTWFAPMGTEFNLCLTLESSDTQLGMTATVAHVDEDSVGFECQNIDLESISHLRRLIELNLGSSEILNRELNALIHT